MVKRRQLPTSADFYVESLPGLPSTSTLSLYSGLLPATTTTRSSVDEESDPTLYFFLSSSRHIARRPKLLIFFSGGPGCGSEIGGFLEYGPLRLRGNRLIERDNSWNEYANVLFVDQPAGAGFSYVTKGDNVRELEEAADLVMGFLSNFFTVFPEYKNQDTYLAGESYAGQNVPYIAEAFLKNSDLAASLKGLIIGNGWFSAREQYPAYLDYLVDEELITKGSQDYINIDNAVIRCKEAIASIDAKNGASGRGVILIPICEEILGVITEATKKQGLCMNQYDTRKYDVCGAEWPPGLKDLTPYLRRPDVIKALHVEATPRQWIQCSDVVSSHFWTPNSFPSVSLLPGLLEQMPILLFAGDKDMMCAHTGIAATIEAMTWGGLKGFNGTEGVDWTIESNSAGLWTSARNLTYVRIYNASHMVPIDPLPAAAAHDMLLRFMAVDTLYAAGEAARVPSRIGEENESVLSPTHPNGTTLEGGIPIPSPPVPKKLIDGGGNILDPLHESYYGPRRTLGLFLLLGFAMGAIYIFFRWRKGKRRAKRMRAKFGTGSNRQRRNGGGNHVTKKERSSQKEQSMTSAGRDGQRQVMSNLARNLSIVREEDEGEGEEGEEGRALFELGEEDGDENDEAEEEDGDIGQGKAENPWSVV